MRVLLSFISPQSDEISWAGAHPIPPHHQLAVVAGLSSSFSPALFFVEPLDLSAQPGALFLLFQKEISAFVT